MHATWQRASWLMLALTVAACQAPATFIAPDTTPVTSLAKLKQRPVSRQSIALGFTSLPTDAKLKQLFTGLPLTVRKVLPEAKTVIVRPGAAGNTALLKQLAKLPGVDYAEWEAVGSVMAAGGEAKGKPAPADPAADPRRSDQWALDQVQAREAWTLTKGSPDTVIAIVDTGIDLKHPDLRSKLVGGYNADQPDKQPMDDYGHGTHVAGIAAAATGNGVGIAGMSPAARLMPIKVNLEGSGGLEESTVAAGILWAANHGADVINLSLGFSDPDAGDFRTLGRAVYYAIQKNCVVVTAMGNSFEAFGANHAQYPAAWSEQRSFNSLIAVGATGPDDQRCRFSDTGSWITLSAPGFGILSTAPTYTVPMTGFKEPGRGNDFGLNYGKLSGTSHATPMISGLAALILSRMQNHEPGLVKLKLRHSVEARDGRDLGAGRVNALQSVRLL